MNTISIITQLHPFNPRRVIVPLSLLLQPHSLFSDWWIIQLFDHIVTFLALPVPLPKLDLDYGPISDFDFRAMDFRTWVCGVCVVYTMVNSYREKDFLDLGSFD